VKRTFIILLTLLVLAVFPLAGDVFPPAGDVLPLLAGARAFAQAPARLYDADPWDEITLNEQNGNRVFKVVALTQKERATVARGGPTDKIRIRMSDDPTKQFDLEKRHIASVKYFEAFLLEEANRLIAAKEFDAAYDYLSVLLKNYPRTPGLAEARQKYLFANAADFFRAGRFNEGLGVLEELYRLNPNFKNRAASLALSSVIGAILDRLFQRYVDNDDFHSVHELYSRIQKQYGDAQRLALDRWAAKLSVLAAAKKEEAAKFVANRDYLEAHQAARKMMVIWPDVEGGREFITALENEHPLVIVGVSELAPTYDSRSLRSFASRRAGRLLHRTLVEYEGHGPEGGIYDFPFGTLSRSEDDKTLVFDLAPPTSDAALAINGYDVSRTLLLLADPRSPTYLPVWAQLASSIAVEDVMKVEVRLRRPHVLPEALLQTYIQRSVGNAARSGHFGPYDVAKTAAEEVRFVEVENYQFAGKNQPAIVIERRFQKRRQAKAALLTGDVDILDRIYPADVAELSAAASITVDRYRLPSVHYLEIVGDKPHLKNRTFRRALLMGVNRKVTLEQTLLEGRPQPGCQLISGPFPAGIGSDDPQGYAYNRTILPRAYNPALALVLATLADRELASRAKKREEEPPKRPDLILGYPPHEIARRASLDIAFQLSSVGMHCEVKELPPGDAAARKACDLIYVEAAVWEPVVDARRLLGAAGSLPEANAFIRLALRRLDTAKNWRETRNRLLELHELVYYELPIIPLWQLTDFFAYRDNVRDLERHPVSLYQDIEQWRILSATSAN